MIAKIKTAWQTARDYGLAWTLRRLYYEVQLRTGHHKRKLPRRVWQAREWENWLRSDLPTEPLLDQWRQSDRHFFFDLGEREKLAAAIRQIHPDVLDQLYLDAGHQRYFSKLEYDLQFPQAWFTNPFLSPPVQCAPDKHWSEYPMHTEDYEDLKFVWESGRFAIVYDWVRAYVLTGDEALAERYWQHIESWVAHNPPNTGPHWKCGQETSLRLMAWYVGWFAFKDCPATTAERFEKWLGAIAAQAYRISQDYHYSYLQQSNHAVSEGLGLYVTGLLFPQLQAAEKWRAMGKRILEERVTFLIRPDGTYC
ncbi:MAG: heparinase II/III family protein [Bacteroidota bacterium]